MSHTLATDEPGARSGADLKWWTLAAVCTGVFMLLLDITIVNVALSDIQRDLSASLSDLQWVIDSYALSLAALLLTAGSLADLYGRRRVFLIGLVLFTVGSTACGAAQSVHFLWAARAFQGIGGAAMFATALALLAQAFQGKERGTAFGVFGATTGVAVAIGPVLGGVLTSYLSWRWIFFVNIPICVIALLISATRVQESRNPNAGTPDWAGFLSFSGALGLLVYGLIEAGKDGFGDGKVVAVLIGAAFLLVVFLLVEVGSRYPMFDLALLRKPTFTGGLIAGFGVSASVFSLVTYLVIYVQNVLGFSPVGAGVRFLFLSGASFVSAVAAGRLTERVPVKLLIAPGFVLAGVGLLLIHGIAESSDPAQWTHLIPGLLVAGFGIGMINPPLASTAVGVVAVAKSGMASGVNSTFRQVGTATGIAALGSIFAHEVTVKVTAGLPSSAKSQADGISEAITGGQIAQLPPQFQGLATQAFVDGLNHIVLIGAIIALTSAVLTFVLIRQKDFVVRGQPPAGADPAGEPGSTMSGAGAHGDHVRTDRPGKHLPEGVTPDAEPEVQGSSV